MCHSECSLACVRKEGDGTSVVRPSEVQPNSLQLMIRPIQQLVLLSLLCSTGCALLNFSGTSLLEPKEPLSADQIAEFENDAPTRNIVRVQTSVMSALATDKRIRDGVWDKLDETGLMSPDDRRRLNQSGIRVGVAGGALPWALQSLHRGEHTEQNRLPYMRRNVNVHSTGAPMGTQVTIPEGSRSVVELPSPNESLTIPAGKIAGLNSGRELTNAHCLIELTPIEYGNGWVVIRFLPQIHHGNVTTRYSMSGTGERMPVRQKIQPLYEQQFDLKLHADETVVIGHFEQDDWTVGRLLFQSESLTARSERLLALQVNAVEKISGQKSLEVNYSKY